MSHKPNNMLTALSAYLETRITTVQILLDENEDLGDCQTRLSCYREIQSFVADLQALTDASTPAAPASQPDSGEAGSKPRYIAIRNGKWRAWDTEARDGKGIWANNTPYTTEAEAQAAADALNAGSQETGGA